ncbi:MAG: SDR family NAD(P)-dependent oxidoreductase [Pseudomonadales bacterium]
MHDFSGKIAVITGGGSGIGRELARQLVTQGCHVAICDVSQSRMNDTLERCHAENPQDVTVSGTLCDVADEMQVSQYVEAVRVKHATDHIDLLINNAGVNGGGSFIESPREEWERTFNICWLGVYLVTRAFMSLLLKSRDGHLVNMSSANAIRAVLGGHVPHTAYSTAKFAVRGFTEALIHDFRFNAPHLSVSVVMPGHTGTGIISNSLDVLGQKQPAEWAAEEIRTNKRRWRISGRDDVQSMSDDEARMVGTREIDNMRELGLPPAEAARVILDGVREKRWRILIGTDTKTLDHLVRQSPETAYDPDFVDRWREANNRLTELD